MTVVACERLDERCGVSTPGKREGGKIEAGSPSFGAAVQQLNIRGRQAQPEDIVQQVVRLGRPET